MQEQSGLGIPEYVSALNVADHADPANKGRRGPRHSYTHYSAKDKAVIGKYALENGNIKAIRNIKNDTPISEKALFATIKGFMRDKTNESKPIHSQSLKLYPGH